MNFSDRITRLPKAYDAERGRDAVAGLGLTGQVQELCEGAAGSSPYLAEVISKEAEWLAEALQQSPETAFDALLEDVANFGDADLPVELRRAKRRVASLIALADLGGIWSLEEVTRALTRFADLATDRALKAAIAAEIRRGRIPGQTEDDVQTAAGLSVISMGKGGAFELNYSSDIDLICLYDETRFSPDEYAEARTGFIRAVRTMCKTLSDRTAEGYVFRTDLRLRPDASVTPVAISMEAAERYYESFGRTWERAAYIKARASAGDIEAGNRFLKALRPFVWRKHLDFAAIQDAHDMRLRIRDHKGLHKTASHLGHDLKLGQGGIREIEFFAQTGQIIAGGRDENLRVSGTTEALRKLAGKNWVGEDVAEQLIADYRALREAEHRVQMIADQQTHLLPATEEGFERLAALAGKAPEDYATELLSIFERVSTLTENFFAPEASDEPVVSISDQAATIVDGWAGYPALRSPRAMEIFNRVRAKLLERLNGSSHPDEALVHFDGFLKGLPAGVQLFSLFEANPQLLDLVVDVVDTAPALGVYLARNSAVFDAVIGGSFFDAWPGAEVLTTELSRALDAEGDYEKQLDAARSWAREWHFRIGVHQLRGVIDAGEAGRQYAELAEAVVAGLWPEVVAQFASKHGDPPGRGAVVLAMGSLGASRLNSASDLDLIVIYDGDGVESSAGRRPLATRAYYSRLTQALVTALSAPMALGRLYEVDMRLRPSGRQGPVATSLNAFMSYQREEAWTWEHLALTRARKVAGGSDLGDEIETFRRELLAQPRARAKVLADVADMRARLLDAKPGEHGFDTKTGPGRFQDLELFTQTGTLIAGGTAQNTEGQIDAAAEAFDLGAEEIALLKEAAKLFFATQSAASLISGGAGLDDTQLGTGATTFLLRNSDCQSAEALKSLISDQSRRIKTLIDHHIGLG